MKWPQYLAMMRHDISAYNELKERKNKNFLYRRFLKKFEQDFSGEETKKLADVLWEKYRLGVGDHNTPLVDSESKKAESVGKKLRNEIELPDVIFVSPYERTKNTFEGLKRGWPELENIKLYEEERIREQDHGLALIYNDWRIFFALNPRQKMLHDIEGPYWYRYPQGENVSDVRERNRSWIKTLIREFAGKKVLAISHHLNILATIANFERWGEKEFAEADEKDKPINCGVTLYEGNPKLGKDGKFVLKYYNKKFF